MSQLTIHVVTHTHWDREWYLPAGRFRQRLVALIDEILDAPGPARVLLDGQTVVLDDYLAVRPERRELLAARLRDGTIEAGPWYVLADELIPSGEALVRNLLAGRATLAALGAEAPPVLYSPDAFGHPAALPTLAAGFGYGAIILWRGYGGPAWPPGDTVRWRAPDGSTVVLYHLPPDGYEFGANLPDAAPAAVARWERIREVLQPRAVLGVALLLNGADHHAVQPRLEAALAALAQAAAPVEVHASSLRTFVHELARRARDVSLPVVSGELRNSYGYTWTLQGTLASRAHLKRRNARAERLLVRDAEPWAALARRHGGRDRRALLRAAWKTLLLCHPHDTLCGCSIDDVARAAEARLDDAEAQARGVREDALLDLVRHDPVHARTRPAEWKPVVLVRNRAARPRGGVAVLDVARLRRHVPVGPGSAPAPTELDERPPRPFALNGGEVRYQLLDEGVRHDRVESPAHYPDDAVVDVARVAAWLDPVPGYGVSALTIDAPDGAAPTTGALPPPVHVGNHWLENEWLRLEIDAAGTVRLEPRRHGATVPSLLTFEDVGDVGDLYTHSPVPPSIGPAAFLGAQVVHAGPLRGELRASWRLDVPISATRAGRAAPVEPLVVDVAFTLDAGARALGVRIRGENRCRDHRLRAVFSTGLLGAEVWADAAFGPVRREPIVAPAGAAEAAPPTAPLARYVTLAGAERGVTVYSDGLAEYEVTEGGDVAITLLRAVGELSRNDLPERPGHAGWPSPTPAAQSLAPFEGRFAILPHGARTDDTIDLVARTADDVLLPLAGTTLRSALGVPAATTGVELEGVGLAFLACKASEDGEWLVLRCVNLTEREVEGRWRCGFPLAEARLARLDESGDVALSPAAEGVAFRAGPRAVVTVLVR